jgi:hypothetical protein
LYKFYFDEVNLNSIYHLGHKGHKEFSLGFSAGEAVEIQQPIRISPCAKPLQVKVIARLAFFASRSNLFRVNSFHAFVVILLLTKFDVSHSADQN